MFDIIFDESTNMNDVYHHLLDIRSRKVYNIYLDFRMGPCQLYDIPM